MSNPQKKAGPAGLGRDRASKAWARRAARQGGGELIESHGIELFGFDSGLAQAVKIRAQRFGQNGFAPIQCRHGKRGKASHHLSDFLNIAMAHFPSRFGHGAGECGDRLLDFDGLRGVNERWLHGVHHRIVAPMRAFQNEPNAADGLLVLFEVFKNGQPKA